MNAFLFYVICLINSKYMGVEDEGQKARVGDEANAPLLGSASSSKLKQHEHNEQGLPLPLAEVRSKRGTVWTATAHIITGVIGAGVLSLSWSIAQLGWLAGILALFAFAGVTIVSAFLLSDCYRSPDPSFGPFTNSSYRQAVRHFLGETNEKICGVVVYESLYGCGVAYTITAAVSMRLMDDNPNGIHPGTVWTCVAHIITAVIGAGVLSLAWSTSQLGWIGGPICLICFAFVTYVSASLMSDCYRSPDPVTGLRNPSYMHAVASILGRKQTWLCGFLQYFSMFRAAVAYVITTSTSIRAIQKSNCYHKEGHAALCSYGDQVFMLLFGCVQVIVSQIPDFHNMDWLSVLAAIMSFSYSSIGLGLGFAKVIENRAIKGSIGGVPASSALKKMRLTCQALGDIAFAYPYAIIVLEIEDTLKSPPAENQTMKKASVLAVLITTFFYLSCGGFGYAAFGDDTPGNILTGFGFYEPYWLIDFANACVVVHLVGGYQIFSQPVFAFVEGWVGDRFPNSSFVNPLRVCFRTGYVATTTGIAMLFPYFNEVIGVLGALCFWPLAIYFPVEMYIVQKNIHVWSPRGLLLRVFSAVCLLVSIAALFGSIQGAISQKL